MKQSIFILLYLLASIKGYSQNAVLSADKMNVVFIGVDNPISVAISGYSDKQINIVSNYGILEGKNGKYIFRISSVPAEQLRFTVMYLKTKRKQLLVPLSTELNGYQTLLSVSHAATEISLSALIT